MPLSPRRFSALLLCVLCVALPATRTCAQSGPPAPPAAAGSATAEFKQLFEKIVTKLKAGQKSKAELAPEIGALDAILTKHAAEKTDEVAGVALMKARL